MGSIQILLGKTRVRRRRAIARNAFSGLDVRGRPNFLYVTDTVRKKETVEAEFLQYRDGAAFLPDVVTLSGLFEDLVRRHGDGRAPWTPGAVALVAERLLATEARWPWLGLLGDPARVGADLARLHAAWDEAGKPTLGGARAGELNAFLSTLDARLSGDRARLPMGEALRRFGARLSRPPPPLAQWLRAHHAVVIDDVLHPTPLRRTLLVQLARAWAGMGAHVVFAFESGRDLGGAEASRFFEYAEDDAVAFPLRPFQATRAFRRALFSSLVAEGGEADLLVAGRDTLHEVAPWAEPGDAEPPDLADRLYAGEAGPVDLGRLALRRWADPVAEVRGIAHAVKARLREGVPASSLWVAFPGLPAYAPLVRRAFSALGIPHEISRGRPVRARPATVPVLVAARAAADGYPLAELLAALASDLVAALPSGDAIALGRACREKGVFAGHPREWRERLADGHAGAVEALATVCDALAPLATPLPPLAWREALLGVVREWDMVARARRCGDRDAKADSLGTLGRAMQAIDEVARDAAAADPGPWPPLRLARALEERLESATLRDAQAGGERVQVVGMLELRGIHPPHLWIGGLVADDFPTPPREDYLLPRAERRALDLPEPADEGRYLLASALRNALAEGHALTLSWPASRDDKPVAVSPLMEDLLVVELGGDRAVRDHVVDATVEGEPPAGPDELDAWLGEAVARGADVDAWLPLARDPDALAALRDMIEARRDPEGFGPRDGVLDEAPSLPDQLGVTALEVFLACPLRYFFGKVLGLEAEDAWDPDLDGLARGTLLHAVLHAFIQGQRAAGRRHLRTDDPGERAALRADLHRVAEEVFSADEDLSALPGPLAHHHRRRWLAGLVDDAPRGLLAAWLDEEMDSDWPTTLEGTEVPFDAHPCGPIRLRGRVDRVDALLSGGLLVVDYKTGKAPHPDLVRAGLKIQGHVYLDALGAEAGAAVYQELRGADKLAHAGWIGDAPSLAALGAPRGAVEVDEDARAETRAYLAAAAERLAAGRFHPTLAGPDLAGCGYCTFARACRVDHDRNATVAARADARWQAPAASEDE